MTNYGKNEWINSLASRAILGIDGKVVTIRGKKIRTYSLDEVRKILDISKRF